jgi:quinol monooxygenase YgiN
MDRVLAFYQMTHSAEEAQGLTDALRTATVIPTMEPGCLSSSIWREAGPSGTVLLMEEWESPQAIERHMSGPVFRRLLAVLELSRTPPEIRYVQGSRSRGMDWITQVLGPMVVEPGDAQERKER